MKARIQTYLYIVAAFLLLGGLFLSRENISNLLAEMQTKRVAKEKKEAMADTIAKRYNYKQNKQNYQVTFLEFGATTCHSCKLMEKVMDEIRKQYTGKVNVVFVNVTRPESKELLEYFGIATIPAQILLDKNGKEYFRHTGYISTEDLGKQFRLTDIK